MQRFRWMFAAVTMLAIGVVARAQQPTGTGVEEERTRGEGSTGAQERPMYQILTASQADNMLKETKFSLCDCTRVAEKHTNGQVLRADFKPFNPARMTGKAAGDYVCEVTVVANGKLTCVLVDAHNGNVIETRNIQTLAEMPFGSPYALAGSEEPPTTPANWFRPAQRCQKATDLMHKEITDSQYNETGKTKDLAVDPDAGRVFVIVATLEDRGDRYFPIPWSAANLATDCRNFVLRVTKDRLAQAQGFEKNDWPNLANEHWLTTVYAFYGTQPYWTMGRAMAVQPPERAGARHVGYTERIRMWSESPARWQKTTDLIGTLIKNPDYQELGKIENLAIDADTGRIMYAVVSFGGFLGIGEKYHAVPWTALNPSTDYKFYTVNMDKNQLKNAPGTFEKNNCPDMTNTEWGREVYKFYNQTPYWEYSERAREEGQK